jgi:hypothetical protein
VEIGVRQSWQREIRGQAGIQMRTTGSGDGAALHIYQDRHATALADQAAAARTSLTEPPQR